MKSLLLHPITYKVKINSIEGKVQLNIDVKNVRVPYIPLEDFMTYRKWTFFEEHTIEKSIYCHQLLFLLPYLTVLDNAPLGLS